MPYCFYCDKRQAQFARHLKVHKKKEYMKDYFPAAKEDKPSILAFIRNKVYTALENRSGIVVPVKIARKGVTTVNEPCQYCGGRFSAETLFKHLKYCYGSPFWERKESKD